MKNNFKKWVALFLSVAMIAVSGITTNTSFRALENAPAQEEGTGDQLPANGAGITASDATAPTVTTAPTDDTSKETAAPTQETTETSDAKNSVDENPTEKTQEVDLDTTTITPTPTEAPTPTEEAEDEEEDQQGSDKTEYSGSADGVTVTAEMAASDDVSNNITLNVTHVTDTNYLNILNSFDGAYKDNPYYTEANTILYKLTLKN